MNNLTHEMLMDPLKKSLSKFHSFRAQSSCSNSRAKYVQYYYGKTEDRVPYCHHIIL